MLPENLLGMPQKDFGSFGIQMGNLVYKQVAELNKEARYMNKKITILNSTDLSVSDLEKKIYKPKYNCWHPVVEKERNEEGNLEISFFYNNNIVSSEPRIRVELLANGSQVLVGRIINEKEVLGEVTQVLTETFRGKLRIRRMSDLTEELTPEDLLEGVVVICE